MPTTTITFSCTANFGPESGCDDNLTQNEIIDMITLDYDIENRILIANDQGFDGDQVTCIESINVEIDCMEDRSSVEYTVTADVNYEDESEDDWE